MTARILVAALNAVLLLPATAGAIQLPPEVLLDQLLLRTERLVEADHLDAAVQVMADAVALGEEHDLKLPSDFRFQHARVAFAVGLLGTAKESVAEYLTVASREAESYVEAVALLEEVDRILERRDAPECALLPEVQPACWMELASHPGCYVWNPNPQPDETVIWTGECSAGFVQGPGTLTWTPPEGSQEHEGNRRYGQPHGESVIRDSEGWVGQGPFVNGKRSGRWIEKTADGSVLEGPYVNDEENGHWVLRFASGAVHAGPYVDGERNGRWIDKDADGDIGEGPYVDGKRNGHWLQRFTDANIAEGPLADDKRNGHWVWKFPDGQMEEGPYVDDERHGRWVVRPPSGDTFYVTFMRGVRQEP